MLLTELERILAQFDEEIQKLEVVANNRQPAKVLERERAKEDIKKLQFDGMNKVPSFLFANTPRDAFFCGFNARNHAPVYVYTLES